MVPLWKKSKSEVTTEEYNAFYKEKFMDYEDPTRVIYTATEGTATYNALLFIPSHAPFNYYTREYEKGLQLYASGVLIMDKCADLLPDYFGFVKGLVDSQDLSLNISREMLQHDRQLKVIAGRLEKKIHTELVAMLNNDREAYEKFFEQFGLQLKYGLYADYGMHKDVLQDLVMFASSNEKKLTTLQEYVDRMPEEQKYIYYACGETVEKAAALPQTELVLDKGYEILYLTADVDEFALKMLRTFADKEFKSVSAEDLGFDLPEEEKTEITPEQTALFEAMTAALEGKVTAVRASKRLKTHPVCLTSEGEISLEMEKVLNAMPGDQKVQARRVLEVNENHPIYGKLQGLDEESLKTYASLLYDQALLIEGMSVEDPVAFAAKLCDILSK
jgi:molecular chaperone HtpG